jgi:hypothetical protein
VIPDPVAVDRICRLILNSDERQKRRVVYPFTRDVDLCAATYRLVDEGLSVTTLANATGRNWKVFDRYLRLRDEHGERRAYSRVA